MRDGRRAQRSYSGGELHKQLKGLDFAVPRVTTFVPPVVDVAAVDEAASWSSARRSGSAQSERGDSAAVKGSRGDNAGVIAAVIASTSSSSPSGMTTPGSCLSTLRISTEDWWSSANGRKRQPPAPIRLGRGTLSYMQQRTRLDLWLRTGQPIKMREEKPQPLLKGLAYGLPLGLALWILIIVVGLRVAGG